MAERSLRSAPRGSDSATGWIPRGISRAVYPDVSGGIPMHGYLAEILGGRGLRGLLGAFSHAGNTSSNPVGDATKIQGLTANRL